VKRGKKEENSANHFEPYIHLFSHASQEEGKKKRGRESHEGGGGKGKNTLSPKVFSHHFQNPYQKGGKKIAREGGERCRPILLLIYIGFSIRRKGEKGKGKKGLIGGERNVKYAIISSSLQTLAMYREKKKKIAGKKDMNIQHLSSYEEEKREKTGEKKK